MRQPVKFIRLRLIVYRLPFYVTREFAIVPVSRKLEALVTALKATERERDRVNRRRVEKRSSRAFGVSVKRMVSRADEFVRKNTCEDWLLHG